MRVQDADADAAAAAAAGTDADFLDSNNNERFKKGKEALQMFTTVSF